LYKQGFINHVINFINKTYSTLVVKREMTEHKQHAKLTKTKIVCTLGPASATAEVLEKMLLAGMDIVRLNFSHGAHEDHKKLFDTVRALSEKYDHQLSIICDIQGPKIRTGKMAEPFVVAVGDRIDVTPNQVLGTKECIQIKYEHMLKDLKEKDTIFINDGIIKLVVEKKNEKSLTCVVEAGGMISNAKGCNIPSGHLSVNVITPKDREDLKFIATLNPEWVASSFIGTAADVEHVRATLKEFGNPDIKIISKIERPAALLHLDEIIEVTDAIMVARGDLGVEIDTWDVPIAQKEMCRKCNAAGKPVIVATQMLESMTSAPRPTRAEASDVFNAVLDGADAVMLSGETSVGKYPVETVSIMDKIVEAAEQHLPARNPRDFTSKHVGLTETIALGSYEMAVNFKTLGFKGKIIVITGPPTGYVGRMVSKFRPPLSIISITEDLRTALELNLVWGVRSFYDNHLKNISDAEQRNAAAIRRVLQYGFLSEDDRVLVIARSGFGKHVGASCSLYSVKEILAKVK
jgi:pyruvate kinase